MRFLHFLVPIGALEGFPLRDSLPRARCFQAFMGVDNDDDDDYCSYADSS